MFYRTEAPHGLPHNPFNGMVIPRPIGWISTLDAKGQANLAPYSFFNAVAYRPPQVMFAATAPREEGSLKDTVANVEATGEFVFNLVTEALSEPMNASSVAAPPEIDEFDYAGLEKAPSTLVKPPRVALSPVHFECVLSQIVELERVEGAPASRMVIGKVVGIHIAEEVMTEGMVDPRKLKPLARLGYLDYGHLGEIFAMARPVWKGEPGG